MNQTGESNWRKNQRKGQLLSQHRGAQIAFARRDGVSRPEDNFLIRSDILAKRHLAFGAAVNVVKNRAWKTPLCQPPQIRDVDHAGRAE
jgi:hypothetical protein